VVTHALLECVEEYFLYHTSVSHTVTRRCPSVARQSALIDPAREGVRNAVKYTQWMVVCGELSRLRPEAVKAQSAATQAKT
jgi:hypothetical protein